MLSKIYNCFTCPHRNTNESPSFLFDHILMRIGYKGTKCKGLGDSRSGPEIGLRKLEHKWPKPNWSAEDKELIKSVDDKKPSSRDNCIPSFSSIRFENVSKWLPPIPLSSAKAASKLLDWRASVVFSFAPPFVLHGLFFHSPLLSCGLHSLSSTGLIPRGKNQVVLATCVLPTINLLVAFSLWYLA